MDPFWILLVGVGVVVGGILLLRLHAFLALTLAALVVGALTTSGHLRAYGRATELSSDQVRKLEVARSKFGSGGVDEARGALAALMERVNAGAYE